MTIPIKKKECCEKCEAIGTPGIIGTPWCGKFGDCPCHTAEAEAGKESISEKLVHQDIEELRKSEEAIRNLRPAQEEEPICGGCGHKANSHHPAGMCVAGLCECPQYSPLREAEAGDELPHKPLNAEAFMKDVRELKEALTPPPSDWEREWRRITDELAGTEVDHVAFRIFLEQADRFIRTKKAEWEKEAREQERRENINHAFDVAKITLTIEHQKQEREWKAQATQQFKERIEKWARENKGESGGGGIAFDTVPFDDLIAELNRELGS